MITESRLPVSRSIDGVGEARLSRAAEGGAARILIVEDNLLSQKLFNDLLEAQGYATIATASGREALDLVHSVAPDLILMDIQLPELSGIEVTRRLKADARTHDIPIIVVTASSLPGIRQQILDSGCDGFIEKPISIDDFLGEIARQLSERRPSGPIVQ
jgi:two-component system, cell cycle response regulator DivK